MCNKFAYNIKNMLDDRNLTIGLSEVKMFYGSMKWPPMVLTWFEFQKKSIFEKLNISDLGFCRVEQVILLYKRWKISRWVVQREIPIILILYES